MKYFSTFSGIGGFELGIQQAYESNSRKLLQSKTTENIHKTQPNYQSRQDRPTCVGYSEIDKYAIQVYNKHFNHKNYGDITTIDEKTLPDFDLFVGGFPCQSFSIAGKRKGFDDTRGTMFFEIARIVREKQPRSLLLENVKGLLSHDKGNTFYTIISTLDELGYDCEWQVLNSKNFGVPQNRERVFIIGHLRGTGGRKIFPLGHDNEKIDELQGQQGITNTLTTRYTATGSGSYITERELNAQKIKVVALTERRTEEAKRLRRLGVVKDTRNLKKLVPRDDELANTVTTGDVKNQSLTDGSRIRRLTPKECERLQGFPDDWTKEGMDDNGKIISISDSQRYKMAGNAVTTYVIKQIMIRLLYNN